MMTGVPVDGASDSRAELVAGGPRPRSRSPLRRPERGVAGTPWRQESRRSRQDLELFTCVSEAMTLWPETAVPEAGTTPGLQPAGQRIRIDSLDSGIEPDSFFF